MSKKALVVYGGWDGHQPKEVGEVFRKALADDGFQVEVSDTLDTFKDESKLMGLNLIVPVWTMGKISNEQINPVLKAVQSGVGMAGCHGGMCDAFRENSEWQFMTGGQFVAHPGNQIDYTVKIAPTASPLTEGIKEFKVHTEQYYMHVDPAIKVLAYTEFPTADGPHVGNGQVSMPVVWTKVYGKGRIYYNSLGHDAKLVASEPMLTLMRRGFGWAAK
jgi:uncharacterized protein